MKYIIIPARGGSKGIPKKNLQKVGNISLVAWSIIHAKHIALDDDEIIVSSDSEEILNEARKYNVTGLLRPEYLSKDETFTEPVMNHVLENYKPNNEDLVVLLQPTSPLRRKKTLEKAIKLVETGSADSSITLKDNHLFFWEQDGPFVRPKYTDRPRRQDMEPQLSETGSIYVTKYKSFLETGIRLSGKTKSVVCEDSESVDVDSLFDLKFVNFLVDEYLSERSKELT